MTNSAVALAVVLTAILGCSGGSKTSQREVAVTDQAGRQGTVKVCGGTDSLVFSTVASDSETEDLSGVEVVLSRNGAGWSGSSREAAGEFLARVPLIAVSGETVPGPVAFSMPAEKDTAVFRGRIYCDSLVGEMRDFRNSPFEPITLKRVQR